MSKRVAIIQSNYIPWKGYFDIIHDVDLFIFLDDVQYTKNDWRNRNKIKTPYGTMWLTIPTGSHLNKLICDIRLSNESWASNHWKTIEQFYSKAPYFDLYKDFFKSVYLDNKWEYLSELNQFLIKSISIEFLGIRTKFVDSREYHINGKKLERLLDLIKKTEVDIYISGPSAKNYINEQRFSEEGIKLEYKDYLGYPEYPQFYPPFLHKVTILDLLFHAGPDAPYYIWGWRENDQKVQQK